MSWLIAGREVVPLGVIDRYGGAAGAYSLRSLSLYYTGPVIRVRRSSDNTESDFTATQVSDGSLVAFVGAGNNGILRTWYDQSGNNRHSSFNIALPSWKIVDSGTLVTSSGSPAINTADATQAAGKRITIPGLAGLARADYFFVKETSDTSYMTPGSATSGSTGYGWTATQGSTSTSLSSNFGSPTLYANGSLQTIVNRGDVYTALNGRKLETTINASLSTWTDFTLCFYAGFGLDALIQEFIVYGSDQSANRTAIESNINAHYAIY
jgi:hypothetical protein